MSAPPPRPALGHNPRHDDAPPGAALLAGAQPELTGDRSIGVLLLHGFSGSPASMRPWANHLAGRGYAVEVPLLPGHGTRWQDLNQVRWTDWYAEAEAALDRLLADLRRGRRRGAVDGRVGGAAAGRGAAPRRRRAGAGQPVRLDRRARSVAAARCSSASSPSLKGVVNDIKKPGEDEVGYHRLPLKGLGEVVAMWKVVVPDLPKVTQPLLYFRSARTTSSTTPPAGPCWERSARATARSGCSTNSYHVATLDHEAEIVFAESADFVARVTS